MSPLAEISVSYSYCEANTPSLEGILSRLEQEVGGVRKPYYAKSGAIDLVAALGIGIGFGIAVTVRPWVSKYFEGLLNADGAKQAGEKHREEAKAWLRACWENTHLCV